MKINPILCIIFISLGGMLMGTSSCKKEVIKTIIQQDTIIQHDTVFVNYSYIEHFNSGNFSELVSFVPIQTIAPVWTNVVYSVLVPNLKTGDVISATVECEVSNEYTYGVSENNQIILGDNSSALPTTTGINEISEANGTIITQPMHHLTISKSGTYKCPTDLGNKYVNFCLYASSGTVANDSLFVIQDYGRLSIIVYRK